MTAVIQMRPEGQYASADLAKLVAELRELLDEEVMHTKRAAEFLDISPSKLYRIDSFPSHQPPGIKGKIYLKSELIQFIKKH